MTVVLGLAVVAAVVVGVVVFVRGRQADRTTEALCAQLSAAQDLDQAFTTLDPATLDPQVQALRKAKSVAPTDIQSSVVTLADFVGQITDEVDATEGDRQQALADALDAGQAQIDAVTAAGTEVQRWAQTNCGLTLAGVGAVATSTTSVPPTTTP